MDVGPYMAYIIYIYKLFILYTKKGVLGVQKNFITSFWQFVAILAIKISDFLKL